MFLPYYPTLPFPCSLVLSFSPLGYGTFGETATNSFSLPVFTVEALVKTTFAQACAFWHVCVGKNSSPSTGSVFSSTATWEAPPAFIKINVHAWWQRKEYSGIAAVLCDHSGKWHKAITVKNLSIDYILVSLWAIYHGLRTAWYRNVYLESDCVQTLSILSSSLHCASTAEN